jgi:hypothetical protein
MTKEIADFILSLNDDQLDFFEDRAAIFEFEGGMDTDLAESNAMLATKNNFNI